MIKSEISNHVDVRRGLRRVAIIGVGAVGSTFAFALASRGYPREIVLYDRDMRKAEGELMDISHCLPYTHPIKMSVGDLDECASCDLVVVTAGAAQLPGETRIDLMKRNAEVLSEFFPRLPKANPHALFAIITNPVDVMTRLAWNLSECSPEQIFGTGTVLDTARFRMLLSHHFAIDPRNIHGYVIGEHGDSEVLAWSRVRIGPYTLEEYAEQVKRPIDSSVRERISHDVRRAAYHIIERKGATNFAIGVSTVRIFESISSNMSTLQTVSRPLTGLYGFEDLCLSMPCLIMRDGARQPMALELAPDEHTLLMHSAETLDAAYQSIGV